jgi:hypothetical protein
VHETDGRYYPEAQGGRGHIRAGAWQEMAMLPPKSAQSLEMDPQPTFGKSPSCVNGEGLVVRVLQASGVEWGLPLFF